MENSIHYIPRALGVILTGATLSANPLKTGRAIFKHRLSIASPNYIMCTEEFWLMYNDILTDVQSIKAIISLDNHFNTSFTTHVLSRMKFNVELFEPPDVLGQEDTAIIYYSSGTSGMPKGIQLTHLNCILHSLPVTISGQDKVKSFKTGFHFGEWSSNYTDFKTFIFLASGKKIVYSEINSIEHLLDTIDKCQVNVVFTIPQTIYQLIHFEAIRRYNLNSLKIIHSRSSPLNTKSIQKAKEMFPHGVQILQAYGMTECGEISSEILGPKGPKSGSVGIPSPGIILKVMDLQTGKNLPPNKNGEICVKGPAVMKGYISAERSTYIEEEGFFKTGDLGYYDDDGYFGYIIDRLKEVMTVSGGYTVAPVLLEAILQLHPGVKEVGVVGKPDKIVGDLPTAFVVRQAASVVTEKDLQDYVAAEVAPYMQLHGGVRFISVLPRNARGKILRRRLREMLNEDEQPILTFEK